MRLDFELSCGIAPVRINSENFELGLRTCFVSLERENCEINGDSKYKHLLDIGAFRASEFQKKTTDRARGAEVGVSVNVEPARGIAAIAAKLGLLARGKREAKSESVTEQSVRVELVVTSGQDRWRVGGLAWGDARTPEGILSGDYFLEERTEDGDPLPLCRLRWIDRGMPMQVTIAVIVSFGSLLIFRSGETGSPPEGVTGEARKVLRRRSQQALSEHEGLLRAHVAGLVAAKKLHDAQVRAGRDVLNNEFTVVRETLVASPDDAVYPSLDMKND